MKPKVRHSRPAAVQKELPSVLFRDGFMICLAVCPKYLVLIKLLPQTPSSPFCHHEKMAVSISLTQSKNVIEKLDRSVREGVEKLELSYTAGGNVKWGSRYGKLWMFLQQLNTESPRDPAVPLSYIYNQENSKHILTQTLVHRYHSSILHRRQKLATTQMSIN